MKVRYNKNRKLIATLTAVLLFLLYYLPGSISVKLCIFSVIAIALNILLIFQTMRVPVMLIISLFLLNYSYIFTIPAFFSSKISGIGTQFNNNHLLLDVLFQLIIGLLILNNLFFIKKDAFNKNKYLSDRIDKFSKNKFDFLIIVASFLGYLFFFLLNNSGKQNNLPFSFTFEYIYIFIILFRIYSKDNRYTKVIVHLMIFFICIKTLIHSGRIEVVESLVLLIALYYEKKLKSWWIIIGSVLLNIFMEYVSILRLHNGVKGWETSKFFFNRFNPPKVVFGNEGDVTQSSMAMVGVVHSHIVSYPQRMHSFFDMLLSQFIPLGNFEQFHDSNVSRYISDFTYTLGGGYIYSQWYFWLGIVGVFLGAFLINQVIKIAYLTKNITIVSITAIYSIILFPRWLVYFFDFLIKIPLLLFYLFCGIALYLKLKDIWKRKRI